MRTRNRTLQLPLIFLIFLIAAACGGYVPPADDGIAPDPRAGLTSGGAAGAEAPGGNAEADGDNAASPPSRSDDQGEEMQPEGDREESSSDEEDAPLLPQYHMTKNYFIKPNDEDADNKVVLLTFDDGPKDEALLTRILDTLDKHEAKAIFFVNGFRVKQKPELLKLIHERGQIIGNHSWDHINLKNEPADVVAEQIGGVQAIVEELTGETPKFFRPPHGAGNDIVREAVKEHGMLYMTWSNGSLDWADNRNNPEGVVETVMKQLLPGSNILMHELEWTAEALDPLLTRIKAQGYRFVDPRLIELEAR